MNITVVLGTAREGRRSEKVARLIFERLTTQSDHAVSFVDVREHLQSFATRRFEKEEVHTYPWHNIASRTDGFVFIIPEYNHGYPGEWKLLMDSLYKSEYLGKVAGLVGVSSGQFGGVRAIELAMLSLGTRGMYVMKDALHFPHVARLFDAKDNLIDKDQDGRIDTYIETFMDTVKKYR